MHKLILTVFSDTNRKMAEMTYQEHQDRLLLERIVETDAAGFADWRRAAQGLYVRRDYRFVPQVVPV